MERRRRRRRLNVDLGVGPSAVLGLRLAASIVLGSGAVWFASGSRGVPYVAVLLLLVLLPILTILLTRTPFGRHVHAVGGNPEAARRAGIEVARVKVACFMISCSMAALGGIVFASRSWTRRLGAVSGARVWPETGRRHAYSAWRRTPRVTSAATSPPPPAGLP